MGSFLYAAGFVMLVNIPRVKIDNGARRLLNLNIA
jgi:hypothetical protein